jgi:hypothetical protein
MPFIGHSACRSKSLKTGGSTTVGGSILGPVFRSRALRPTQTTENDRLRHLAMPQQGDNVIHRDDAHEALVIVDDG